MRKARCGNPDLGTYDSISQPVNIDRPASLSNNIQSRSSKTKTRKNNTNTHYWPKKELKWFISVYPKQQKSFQNQEQIRRIINQAFLDWQKYSGLKFQMASNSETADLKIKFQSKDHDDGFPFDGRGATLAHAFYPTHGDIHFDDDELFTDSYKNENEQYTLRLVAAHEIGHALGLSHSFEEGALMYPVYQQFNATYELPLDDQREIQTFYGKPQVKHTTEQPTMTSTSSSNLLPVDNWCSGEFQTGCEGPNNELYLFKDNLVWRYQAKKKQAWDPQPKLINEHFPTLADTTITACAKSSIGYTYLFRDHRVWKLKTHWHADGPYVLHGKHYPQNPRVALRHQNSIYLIRNRLIYRLDEFDQEKELEMGTIDSILNPPPNEFIHAGFTYNQHHYIFTKRFVYVYDAKHGNLLPNYPKSMVNGWFACESATKTQRKPITATRKILTTKKPRIDRHHENEEQEDDNDQHFHHHHHHHYRPRRPFRYPPRPPLPSPHEYHQYNQGSPHQYRAPPYPPPSPYEYRRRWDD